MFALTDNDKEKMLKENKNSNMGCFCILNLKWFKKQCAKLRVNWSWMMAAVVTKHEESKQEPVDKACDSALLLIDIQKQYYSNDKHVKENHPDFPEMIKALMVKARAFSANKQLLIVHSREIDNEDSLWMGFWNEMNPRNGAKWTKERS